MKPQSNNLIAPNDYYRLIDLEQVDEDTGRITKAKDVSELGSDKILLEKNSIIISKLQPEKGKVAIITDEFDGCVGSSEFIPFVLNSDEVLLEYVWLILRSDYVLKQWGYQLTGSSRMRIGPNEINNTIIPLPNLSIQADIVKNVKENINKIDKEAEKNKKLLEESTINFNKMLF
jgi:restriction endonuclease S subunit